MFEELRGKRLLIMGGISLNVDIVKTAKNMGITTIVIDYYSDSPAKKVADESYQVSTTDVDAVVELCKKKKIDGIFTGFVDSLLPYARKICDIMKFPFYATNDQIELSLNKEKFQMECEKNSVPVPKTYSYDGVISGKCKFPILIKPIDSSGGRGVFVVQNKNSFIEKYTTSLSFSPSKRIIIEEYLIGDEISVTYTLKNGIASLSCMKDRLLSKDHDHITSLADVYIMPSRYLNEYLRDVHPYVLKFLKNIKATDGSVFFQGVATKDGIKLFELGYRANGASDYRLISSINGINYIQMMICHALTGEMGGYDLSMDDPHFKEYILNFHFFAHGGKICFLSNMSFLKNIKNVVAYEPLKEVGDTLIENDSLLQRVFRIAIKDKNINNIIRTIKLAQSEFKVLNEKRESILFKQFDCNRLLIYKNK